MTVPSLVKKIRERGFLGDLREAEPLSRHLHIKVGGPAALFAVPESAEDILELLECLKQENIPWVLLGGGTNTIFTNGGYPGCVIRLGRRFERLKYEEGLGILAGAGAGLNTVIEFTAARGLTGVECFSGIPGTVGGAIIMNAGTRDGEMSDVVREVRVFDGESIVWLPAEKLGLSYRSSNIPSTHVILEARIELTPSEEEQVRSNIRDFRDRRRGSQPVGLPSAGCWFKNPEGDSAGRLIDGAGLKGKRIGNAQVSEIHANFLINLGGASSADFLDLARHVKDAVKEQYGIVLDEEVRIVHG